MGRPHGRAHRLVKRTRKALKVNADGFWIGIVYTIVELDDGSRQFELWSVRVEATEQDLNIWIGQQPKE